MIKGSILIEYKKDNIFDKKSKISIKKKEYHLYGILLC